MLPIQLCFLIFLAESPIPPPPCFYLAVPAPLPLNQDLFIVTSMRGLHVVPCLYTGTTSPTDLRLPSTLPAGTVNTSNTGERREKWLVEKREETGDGRGLRYFYLTSRWVKPWPSTKTNKQDFKHNTCSIYATLHQSHVYIYMVPCSTMSG